MNPMNEAWGLLKARQSQMVDAKDYDAVAGYSRTRAPIHPALYNEQIDRESYNETDDDGTPSQWTPETNKEGITTIRRLSGDDFDGDASINTNHGRGVRSFYSNKVFDNKPVRMPRPDAGQAMGFEQGFSPNLGRVRGKIANFQNQRALRQNAIPQQNVFQPR